MHTDRHFLKMVKSCLEHLITCESKKTGRRKFSRIQCCLFIEESNKKPKAIYVHTQIPIIKNFMQSQINVHYNEFSV